ncbi:MAG TPA: discoidin domain-containing protein, partial [Bacilli bacterium]|nr:discoidin domain-containing protein [Bacilli bacterium]
MKMRKIVTVVGSLLALIIPATSFSIQSVGAEEREYGVDLAFDRRVVSSPYTDNHANTHAVDGRSDTRYASIESDDVFFYINLGSREKIGKVVIAWEAAYAADYKILLSNDALDWTVVARVQKTDAKTDEIIFPQWIEAEYVRFEGVDRATGYGYSFWSFEVYGPRSLTYGSQVLEVSSNENETALNKSMMVDNLANTRWASNNSAGDNQYFLVDLGEVK